MNRLYRIGLTFVIIAITVIQTSCKANDSLFTIPFLLYDDVTVLKVRINDSEPLNFIFDSGTTTSLIDSVTAMKIGLFSTQSEGLMLSNDYEEMPLAKVKTIKAGNVTITDRPVIIEHSFENYYRILGIPIHGIIGLDFFGKYKTEIDFDKMQIQLGNNLDTSGFLPINAIIHNALFYVDASIFTTIHDSISHRFLFDTGDMTSISLAEPFWKNNNLLSKCKSYYSGINRSSSGSSSASYFGSFEKIGFYNYHFNGVYINMTSANRGFFSNDTIAGTLGIDILKRFTIIFDLNNEKIYIKPNKKFNESYRINTTGLRARLNKDITQCIIEAVLLHSPAEQAGIQSGDVLISINGIIANSWNISQIRQLTRSKPGTKLLFIIKRGSEQKEMELTSKEFSDL
jgi:hypothetical protein